MSETPPTTPPEAKPQPKFFYSTVTHFVDSSAREVRYLVPSNGDAPSYTGMGVFTLPNGQKVPAVFPIQGAVSVEDAYIRFETAKDAFEQVILAHFLRGPGVAQPNKKIVIQQD
jgi:hypothetical protein